MPQKRQNAWIYLRIPVEPDELLPLLLDLDELLELPDPDDLTELLLDDWDDDLEVDTERDDDLVFDTERFDVPDEVERLAGATDRCDLVTALPDPDREVLILITRFLLFWVLTGVVDLILLPWLPWLIIFYRDSEI